MATYPASRFRVFQPSRPDRGRVGRGLGAAAGLPLTPPGPDPAGPGPAGPGTSGPGGLAPGLDADRASVPAFVFRETAFSRPNMALLVTYPDVSSPVTRFWPSAGVNVALKPGNTGRLARIWPFFFPFWVQFFVLGVFSGRFRQKSRPVWLPAPRSRNVAEKAHDSALPWPHQPHHPYWRPSTSEARYHQASTGPIERPGSSAVGSAPALGAGGRGFKSPLPDKETPGQKRHGGAFAGSPDAPCALCARSPARGTRGGTFPHAQARHLGSLRKLPSGRWGLRLPATDQRCLYTQAFGHRTWPVPHFDLLTHFPEYFSLPLITAIDRSPKTPSSL